jgi:hypothetical protein
MNRTVSSPRLSKSRNDSLCEYPRRSLRSYKSLVVNEPVSHLQRVHTSLTFRQNSKPFPGMSVGVRISCFVRDKSRSQKPLEACLLKVTTGHPPLHHKTVNSLPYVYALFLSRSSHNRLSEWPFKRGRHYVN